jgi:hypothetical protein
VRSSLFVGPFLIRALGPARRCLSAPKEESDRAVNKIMLVVLIPLC